CHTHKSPVSNQSSHVYVVDSEMNTDRSSFYIIDYLITWLSASPGLRRRFSRIRSKTTIVSWTEKPMIVRTAVTKRLSTSIFRKYPRIAKIPRTTAASWRSAMIAAMPYRNAAQPKLRNAHAMSSTIRRLARAIDLTAFWMSSAENDGLTTDEFVILVSGPKVSFNPASVLTSSGGSISVVRTSTPPPA